MKRISRWALRGMLVILVLLATGILLFDTIARKVLEHEIWKQTGLKTRIASLNIGLRHPEITIEHLVIYDTPEFGGAPFIDLPELHVEYDRDALLAGKLHCYYVNFDLAQVNLVEDQNGRVNLDWYNRKFRATAPSVAAHASENSQPAKNTRAIQLAGIDSLNLTLGKATYRRLQSPEKVQELNMNVDHQLFQNIHSAQDLNGALFVAFIRGGVNPMQNGVQQWLQWLLPEGK